MLLGYADASESAYGAVVYMHSVKEDGTTSTKLIGSKSRVAPIKVNFIPRLELSACLLLAQLVEKVRLSLQVVTELTTETMITTLKRLFSRRGKSTSICTDNAMNFIGASRELQRLNNLIRNPPDSLANYLTNEEIIWKFIPPRSPNFGGLWEAGVKSLK
ncbi:integrase catalytic domain-containing protein [Trichonephila clavipes]|nr:integrase catalytic domain-containing protein [Trichonephila clavipes]